MTNNIGPISFSQRLGTLTQKPVVMVALACLLTLLISVWSGFNQPSRAAMVVVLVLGLAIAVGFLRRHSFEFLLGLAMLPLMLLYPLTLNPIIPGVPALSAVRMFLLFLLFGVLFLNNSGRKTVTTWPTVVFRLLISAVLLYTLLSALGVTKSWGNPVLAWSNHFLPIFLTAALATFIRSPQELIKSMAFFARPLALMLSVIAVIEYVNNRSLYGLEIRSVGLDRRVPGPMMSAEVLGFAFAMLAALILYYSSVYKKSWWNQIAIVACVVGNLLTFFRSSWFSMLIVLGVYFFFYSEKTAVLQRLIKNMYLASGLLLAAFLLAFVVYADMQQSGGNNSSGEMSVVDTLAERLFSENAQNSAGNRTTFAKAAKLMIAKHPLTGVGFNQFPYNLLNNIPGDISADQFQVIFKERESIETAVTHNSFVQLAAECGLPMLVLFILANLIPVTVLFFKRKTVLEQQKFIFGLALTLGALMSFNTQSMLYYGAQACVWYTLLLGALLHSTDPKVSRLKLQ